MLWSNKVKHTMTVDTLRMITGYTYADYRCLSYKHDDYTLLHIKVSRIKTRYILSRIIEVILLFAKQNIPMR